MGFRDRFYTPTTAKAILSWRLALGVGVAVVLGLVGLPIVAAIGLGAGLYAGSVLAAVPRTPKATAVDPFMLGEPWRQLIQGAQGAERDLRTTIATVSGGPLRKQLEAILAQVDRGLDDAWQIARSGDAIDDAVRRLDPTGLRSKLGTLEARAAAEPTPDNQAAVESVREQLASVERMSQRSAETASALRLTQTQLEALVARASEVSLGVADTDAYAKEVDDLVLQLEALRQASEETRSA